LNLGCGDESFGDVKADVIRSKTTNVICDAQNLPFRGGVFSFVISHNVFEHLGNPLQSLKDQYRVLKENGKISLTTDNASYWRFHFLTKSIHVKYRGRGEKDKHFMLFMPFHLETFFKEAGFESVTWFWVEEKLYRITGVINWILRRIPLFRHTSYTRIKIEGYVKNDK